MFQFVQAIMTIFPFILISRDGVENLIAKAIHLFSVRNVMLGYASQDLPIVLKNSMIRKYLFYINQWLYWWTILMADSLEPYIILHVPLFFADFNLLLRCIIQSLFTEKALSFFSVSWPHIFGPNHKFWRFFFLSRMIFLGQCCFKTTVHKFTLEIKIFAIRQFD